MVRKVVLKYKLKDEKKFRTVSRPIHGIAVIVPIEEQKDEATPKKTKEGESKNESLDTQINVAASVCDCSPITNKSNLNPYAEEFQSNNITLTR